MKHLFAFVLSLLVCVPASAQLPQPPEIAARQYLLIDLSSNQVLAEREADAQAEPASLTKLMTAYLSFNAVRDKKLALDQKLPVSLRAWAQRKGGGSLMFIDTTMRPTVDELLKGMIVQSGNDASVALAEGVAGSLDRFVEMMNRQAQAWGLKNTQFRNVTGLSEPGHHSSARDVATIAAKIIAEHPGFYPLYSLRNYSYNGIKQDNRNLLLGRDPAVDGMKTGYTEAAGYCLVASAARELPAVVGGKRRLLSVVMGTASRGPNTTTSAGINMIEVPKPTTPPTVPATSPSSSTSAKSISLPDALNRYRIDSCIRSMDEGWGLISLCNRPQDPSSTRTFTLLPLTRPAFSLRAASWATARSIAT